MRGAAARRGSTLVELLVVLALVGVVLLLAVAVEASIVRRLRAEAEPRDGWKIDLALHRMKRDIREASSARVLEPEDEAGPPVLVLGEAARGNDVAYMLDDQGRLLRAVVEDPSLPPEGRVVLEGVVRHEVRLVSSMRLVVVDIRLSDGTHREVTYGLRSRPGAGWGGLARGRGGAP